MKRSAWRYLWKSEDIRKKLLFTLLFLVIYRIAANIPVPNINRAVLTSLATSGGAAGTLINLFDLLSGGTVSNFGNGRLSLHHCPDYFAIIEPHHPCPGTQDEGKSP
jgi:preprotein translocase subunit SecY